MVVASTEKSCVVCAFIFAALVMLLYVAMPDVLRFLENSSPPDVVEMRLQTWNQMRELLSRENAARVGGMCLLMAFAMQARL